MSITMQENRLPPSTQGIRQLCANLTRLLPTSPDTYKLTGQDEVSKTYSFPKSYVSYRKPRAVSTEQRERARQMMIAKNKAKEN